MPDPASQPPAGTRSCGVRRRASSTLIALTVPDEGEEAARGTPGRRRRRRSLAAADVDVPGADKSASAPNRPRSVSRCTVRRWRRRSTSSGTDRYRRALQVELAGAEHDAEALGVGHTWRLAARVAPVLPAGRPAPAPEVMPQAVAVIASTATRGWRVGVISAPRSCHVRPECFPAFVHLGVGRCVLTPSGVERARAARRDATRVPGG